MNLSSRLGIEERPLFEKVLLRVSAIGAIAGVFSLPFTRLMLLTDWAMVFGGVVTVVLLGASSLRGRDDTLPLQTRALCVVLAGVIGLCFGSVPAALIALGALTGLAMAGPRTAPPRQHLVGAIGGALGVGWGLWIVPEMLRVFQAFPIPALAIGASAISAMLFGLGLVAPQLRLDIDALSARLRTLGSESGQRLRRTWDRCHQALRRAPAQARAEVIRLLDTMVREAELMLTRIDNLDARLGAANPADAQAQLAELKAEVATTSDTLTRKRLQSAAGSLSDSLEHLQTLERKRERFGAELKLRLVTLERAALALEAAQGEPEELKALVLRLRAP